MLRRIFKAILIAIILPLHLYSQTDADFLRSTGKMNTVMVVMLILLFGIGFYLFRLNQKINKLEKDITDEQ